MKTRNWWDDASESSLEAESKNQVMKAFATAEKKKKATWKELFHDVYHDLPNHLRLVYLRNQKKKFIIDVNFFFFRKQMSDMENHLQKFGKHYPLAQYKN